MSGIEEIPGTCRAMGYTGTIWVNQAVNTSGEVKIANGATLLTYPVVRATNNSGGVQLASGPCERVILRVPELQTSGQRNGLYYTYSGTVAGIMLGGKSGNQPFVTNILSGDSFNICSGKGLWLPPGTQKELYVQNLNEVYVVGEPSGYPVTFVAEVTV